ncbi:MAG: type III pantothenate kinase [Dehalococcoidia bacterium]|nr:type III pantothenate kinase [Dehalococcoidia bacterium]
MLLAVDIGNTNLKFAVFDGEHMVVSDRLSTGASNSPSDTAEYMCAALARHGIRESDIDGVSLCSVVPPLTTMMERAAAETFGVTALDIKRATRRGVTLDVDKPDGVGTDRIVNAAAAYGLYGGPGIVVDFGTATTFDVVTEHGVFIGGVIAPGISLASEALTARAAQLPPIAPVFPENVIGRDTDQAMRSGLMYGYLGLMEGVIQRIRAEIGSEARVIATGGLVEPIAERTTFIDELEPDLTLQGLRLIWELNQG